MGFANSDRQKRPPLIKQQRVGKTRKKNGNRKNLLWLIIFLTKHPSTNQKHFTPCFSVTLDLIQCELWAKLFHSECVSTSILHCLHFCHLFFFFKVKIHMGKQQTSRTSEGSLRPSCPGPSSITPRFQPLPPQNPSKRLGTFNRPL